MIPPWLSTGENDPEMLCTLDHLDEKFSGRRGLMPGMYRRVVACKRCNCSRSNKNMPLDERRGRANAFPIGRNNGPLTYKLAPLLSEALNR